MFIYGVIEDLYQKIMRFSKSKFFFFICCIRLSTVLGALSPLSPIYLSISLTYVSISCWEQRHRVHQPQPLPSTSSEALHHSASRRTPLLLSECPSVSNLWTFVSPLWERSVHTRRGVRCSGPCHTCPGLVHEKAQGHQPPGEWICRSEAYQLLSVGAVGGGGRREQVYIEQKKNLNW